MQISNKINLGNFFEDFYINQELIHPLPRTISSGDVSLYIGLTGSRFALHSSLEVAKDFGYEKIPLDDLLVFHLCFARSVQDISLNALANLGYADIYFGKKVFVGDTISLKSKIIGLKENSNKKTGVVYVHSKGFNQKNEEVINLKRWVMIHKKNLDISSNINEVPKLGLEAEEKIKKSLENKTIINIPKIKKINIDKTGGKYFFEDYQIDERLNHSQGFSIDNSSHTIATNLYQNNAKVHFDSFLMSQTPNKKRLVYGGHIISLVRSICFNGFENAQNIYSINSGVHANPSFAGDTIYAFSEVLEKIDLKNRDDIGLLRIRSIGLKNQKSKEIENIFNDKNKYKENIVLDLDYTIIIPKKGQKNDTSK